MEYADWKGVENALFDAEDRGGMENTEGVGGM